MYIYNRCIYLNLWCTSFLFLIMSVFRLWSGRVIMEVKLTYTQLPWPCTVRISEKSVLANLSEKQIFLEKLFRVLEKSALANLSNIKTLQGWRLRISYYKDISPLRISYYKDISPLRISYYKYISDYISHARPVTYYIYTSHYRLRMTCPLRFTCHICISTSHVYGQAAVRPHASQAHCPYYFRR